MLVNDGSFELGEGDEERVAAIQAALVATFGSDAIMVAEEQLHAGQHEPGVAMLWKTIADRLRR